MSGAIKKTAREIASTNWEFQANRDGSFSLPVIQTAAMLDAAASLRRIAFAIDSLGSDGIHSLIRAQLVEVRAAAKARRARAKRNRQVKNKDWDR